MSSRNWKKIILGEVIEINEMSISSNYPHKIIEYIDTSSVTNNRFENVQKLSIGEAPSRAKRIVRNGDTIISTVRPIQRHFGYIQKAKENTIVSTGFAVLTPKKINPEFLYYYISQDTITLYLNAIAETTTTTFPAFRPDTLQELEVEIPESIQEQERIASIFSALDEKIELNRQTNQTLEAIAQAIYKEWFVNFEFPGAIGEMQDSELGPIPEGWRVGELGEIVEFIKGVSYRSSELLPSKYALVTLKSIARGGGFNNDGFKEFNGRHKETQTLVEGDTVIAQTDITQNAEVVGCPAIVENPLNYEKLIASIDIVKCLSKNADLTTEAIYYFLKDQRFKDYCLSHTNGSTVLHLRSSELPNYKLAMPEQNILKLFCRIIREINLKMLENNHQARTLVRMRDSLLPRLMNGEMEV